MESNQSKIDSPHEKVKKNVKVINLEEKKYLYPNGHRITHQMRWFKLTRDRGSSSNIAA